MARPLYLCQVSSGTKPRPHSVFLKPVVILCDSGIEHCTDSLEPRSNGYPFRDIHLANTETLYFGAAHQNQGHVGEIIAEAQVSIEVG